MYRFERGWVLLTVALRKGHERKDPLVRQVDVDGDDGSGLFNPGDLQIEAPVFHDVSSIRPRRGLVSLRGLFGGLTW